MQATITVKPDGEAFFAHLSTYLPLEERKEVHRAFDVARREHGDERRRSGELFFTHPLTVASYLAEYYVDAPALIAALLHDVAEDTSVSVREIEKDFGPDVGRIVDGLTKFDRVTAKAKLGRELTADEVKSATLYKLFEMMTTDVRVGIVKIFDRLHNMRTIGAMPPHKQAEKARETLSVYAPLANRLGMWKVKNELQELSLQVTDPYRFKRLQAGISQRDKRNIAKFPRLFDHIEQVLKESMLSVIEVLPAPEDLHASYVQWVSDKAELNVFDAPPRVVVLVESEADCYMALGAVHKKWRPVQGEFDDYIAAPRDNLYRSLHTTVIYDGRPVKIRIRTLNMQIESQAGVLSKWMNNNNLVLWGKELSDRVDNFFLTIEENIREEESAIDEGVQRVIDDVFTNQIIVYTPDGDMRELPQGATPIDFAYTIHTAVGHSTRAALVNGEKKSLTHPLVDGDSVKIIRHGTDPQRAWLNEELGYLSTSAAKGQVRRWFRRLPSKKAIFQGKNMFQEELAMLSQSHYDPETVAQWFGYESEDELYHALGRAEILPSAVATKVLADSWSQGPIRKLGRSVRDANGELFRVRHAGDRVLRLCGTCKPRPGDSIVGFIRKDDTLTIHRDTCRTLTLDSVKGGRSLRLRWGEDEQEVQRPATLQVNVHDRDGLLKEITDVLSIQQTNITMLCSRVINYKAVIVLGIEVASPKHVVSIIHRIQSLVNVINVRYVGQSGRMWTEEGDDLTVTCPVDLLQDGICSLHEPHIAK